MGDNGTHHNHFGLVHLLQHSINRATISFVQVQSAEKIDQLLPINHDLTNLLRSVSTDLCEFFSRAVQPEFFRAVHVGLLLFTDCT